jgi:hypothetical protein
LHFIFYLGMTAMTAGQAAMLFKKSCLGKGGFCTASSYGSTVAEGSPIGLVATTTNETAVPLVYRLRPFGRDIFPPVDA